MKNSALVSLSFLMLLGLSSCIHENFDEPPLNVIPEGNVLTIGQIRDMYIDSIINVPNATLYKFTGDFSVYGVVTMDDKSGNIYKAAYVQDETGAINLRLLSSGGIYEGDSVRIYLKGTVLSSYQNMLQLDSVDVDKNIIKQATLRNREPEEVTIGQIMTGNYQAKLVKINNVQFIQTDVGQKYADPLTLATINRTIEDCDGNTMIVRTSGYASFAGSIVPEGKGSIIAIVGQYRDDWQLYIRSTEEVEFDHLRCGEYNALLEQDFSSVVNNETISLSGWKNIATTGSAVWLGQNNGIDARAKISGTGDNVAWLITPAVNLDASSNEYLTFVTRALNILGAELKIYISTDYDGGNSPETATWTQLTASIATNSNETSSGNIDISAYSGNVYIAFKYSGLSGATGDFYLDNVVVAWE